MIEITPPLKCPKCGSSDVIRFNAIEAQCKDCKHRGYETEFTQAVKRTIVHHATTVT